MKISLRIRIRRFAPVCLLVAALCGTRGQNAQSPSPANLTARANFGRKLQIAGIPNAGQVSAHLYRGAQPEAGTLGKLKALGVTTIVDLRREGPDTRAREQSEAESLGLHFVSIPLGGFSTPTSDQVAQFLKLLAGNSSEIVFVHCHYGDDRTGVFVATYRIGIEKWPVARAMDEMNYFGFRAFWHPAMSAFVRGFPSLLASVPALQALDNSKPAASGEPPLN